MQFGAGGGAGAVAKSRGDLREAVDLALLVAVHQNEDAEGFLGCIRVQATERVRDPMSVLHHDVALHVLEGSMGPPVV